jgi:hypothetical protein
MKTAVLDARLGCSSELDSFAQPSYQYCKSITKKEACANRLH